MQYSSDIKVSSAPQLITINNCGELRVGADSHIQRYSGRKDYQLIYIREGHCVVTLEGMTHIAYPGNCILYRPGQVQDYLLPKKADPCTYWIHFNGDICQSILQELSLEDVSIIKAEPSREIEYLISKVCQYYNLQIPNRERICSGLMQSILALLSNELYKETPSATGTGKAKISEVISRIQLAPGMNMSVTKCAQLCNMSKVHFSRVFKQTVGMPPMKFMLKLRIDRARELLEFTDKPIAEIAEASGFQDQSYFARTFKQLTGMSPTQFRKK